MSSPFKFDSTFKSWFLFRSLMPNCRMGPFPLAMVLMVSKSSNDCIIHEVFRQKHLHLCFDQVNGAVESHRPDKNVHLYCRMIQSIRNLILHLYVAYETLHFICCPVTEPSLNDRFASCWQHNYQSRIYYSATR